MPRVFMFDAYGTLFDVHSAVVKAGAQLGGNAAAFSALWRQKQLEYTWTYTIMNRADGSADFAILTERALDYCLAFFKVAIPGLREALLDAYQHLDAFPEVSSCLADLKAAGHTTAIFTNGTRAMIDAAVAAANLGGLIDVITTVEGMNQYKPAQSVYQHAEASVGVASGTIVFVSSNRWDVAGAANYGFTPVWCNRTHQPSEYVGFDPIVMVSDLNGLGGV